MKKRPKKQRSKMVQSRVLSRGKRLMRLASQLADDLGGEVASKMFAELSMQVAKKAGSSHLEWRVVCLEVEDQVWPPPAKPTSVPLAEPQGVSP